MTNDEAEKIKRDLDTLRITEKGFHALLINRALDAAVSIIERYEERNPWGIIENTVEIYKLAHKDEFTNEEGKT
jgi:hypothetical protein